MTINTFDQKMPPFYRAMHIAARLQYFIDNFIVPNLFKRKLIDNEKKDITLAISDKDRIVFRYKGEDRGVIILVGSDFSFIGK